MSKHCNTCRCHEVPLPEPVHVGQWIRDRLTGEIGQVESLNPPNPPWHNGGTPYVKDRGYWHYYDIVDEI